MVNSDLRIPFRAVGHGFSWQALRHRAPRLPACVKWSIQLLKQCAASQTLARRCAATCAACPARDAKSRGLLGLCGVAAARAVQVSQSMANLAGEGWLLWNVFPANARRRSPSTSCSNSSPLQYPDAPPAPYTGVCLFTDLPLKVLYRCCRRKLERVITLERRCIWYAGGVVAWPH